MEDQRIHAEHLEERLRSYISKILPLDQQAMDETQNRLDQLTKPHGSLGRLEEIAKQLAGICRVPFPHLSRKAVVVMAADHGVCAEQVSAYPQAVTAQMVVNMLNGGAAVNVLARQAGADVFCVDIGVISDFPSHPSLIEAKIKRSSGNIAAGPAMTREEAIEAIFTGIQVVERLADEGYKVIGTGEMGIGNTTPSAAVLAAMTGIDVNAVVGRGTGIDDERLEHKRQVVRRALNVNKPAANDPLDVLHKVGGLDIAGLVGVMIGAAHRGLPVVIDGFISSAAALVASKLSPVCRDYMIPSHLSQEQGHKAMLDSASLRPMLQMDMRLGEGTGAVLCFHLLEASVRIMTEMATFESAGVSRESAGVTMSESAPGHVQAGEGMDGGSERN